MVRVSLSFPFSSSLSSSCKREISHSAKGKRVRRRSPRIKLTANVARLFFDERRRSVTSRVLARGMHRSFHFLFHGYTSGAPLHRAVVGGHEAITLRRCEGQFWQTKSLYYQPPYTISGSVKDERNGHISPDASPVCKMHFTLPRIDRRTRNRTARAY